FFFFSSRRRHTRWPRDWSSDVCSSDLLPSPKSSRTAWHPGGRSARLRLSVRNPADRVLAAHARLLHAAPQIACHELATPIAETKLHSARILRRAPETRPPSHPRRRQSSDSPTMYSKPGYLRRLHLPSP